LLGPDYKNGHGVREGLEDVNELLGLHAVDVGATVLSEGGVSLTGLVVHQDLVVAKVIGSIQHEKFVFKLIPEGHHHFAFVDHAELTEVLLPLDDALVGDVDAAVQRHNEKRDELIACVSALVSKNVLELRLEIAKQFAHQFKPESWLELL